MAEFKVHIEESRLEDLKSRIINTRWTDEIAGSGWDFGPGLSYMKELAEYWMQGFSWRNVENEINSYSNFIEEIDGHHIHFIFVKGKGKKSVPLIITHGWPGSFLEMMKIIPLLTNDQEFSFDLVIPSIPGFGFSERITKPGCNAYLIADLWVKLMKKLGYDKFIAQGGDFGAGIATALALKHAEHISGIHLNYIPGSYQPFLKGGEKFTEVELKFLASSENWYQSEGAYAHQHRTKPLTLAYGLNDSPVGLCAWILEKFFSWADSETNKKNPISIDELLANVTLYWLTGTIHSSIRLYNENSLVPFHFTKDDFVGVPVGIAYFPYELPFPPRYYIERGYHVMHWSEMRAGGHFAALEQPGLLADDIRNFAMKIF